MKRNTIDNFWAKVDRRRYQLTGDSRGAFYCDTTGELAAYLTTREIVRYHWHVQVLNPDTNTLIGPHGYQPETVAVDEEVARQQLTDRLRGKQNERLLLLWTAAGKPLRRGDQA